MSHHCRARKEAGSIMGGLERTARRSKALARLLKPSGILLHRLSFEDGKERGPKGRNGHGAKAPNATVY